MFGLGIVLTPCWLLVAGHIERVPRKERKERKDGGVRATSGKIEEKGKRPGKAETNIS